MGSEIVAGKGVRAKNFSPDEIKVLVELVLDNYDHLFGELSPTITNKTKTASWSVIASTVTAVSGNIRDAEKCKDKFTHWKSETKKKASKLYNARIQSGGGNHNESDLSAIEEIFDTMHRMNDIEKKLIKKMGVEAVVGIAGGKDVFSIPPRRPEETPCTSLALLSQVPPNLQDTCESDKVGKSCDKNKSGQMTDKSGEKSNPTSEQNFPKRDKKSKNDDISAQLLKGQDKLIFETKRIGDILQKLVDTQQERLRLLKEQHSAFTD